MKKENKSNNQSLFLEAIADISDRTFIVLGLICAISLIISTTLLIICAIKINEMEQVILELETFIEPYLNTK